MMGAILKVESIRASSDNIAVTSLTCSYVTSIFYVIPFYLQSVLVHLANCV
jgi:hypothetical protein